MFISELFEDDDAIPAAAARTVVIYPGRFMPFHKGHKAVYDYLVSRYGRDNVFITTSNKVAPPRSPFSFSDKLQFMHLTGVPNDSIVETPEPYRAPELVNKFDPSSTRLLFAVSEKDMAEDPRFAKWTKKDGQPTYFQPMPKDPKEMQLLDRHAYIMTVPTFNFTVLGQPMKSATEVRAQFSAGDEATKKAIIKDLFGAYDEAVYNIMQQKLSESEYQVSDFNLAVFESMQTYMRYVKSASNTAKRTSRYYPSRYDSLLYESADGDETLIQAKKFSEQFTRFDQREHVKIKVGASIAVLSTTLASGVKEIELDGFVKPKKITKINLDINDQIDSIQFEDGSTFPERAEFTTVHGQNITNTLFFNSEPTASKAFTAIWMLISYLESQGWAVNNQLTEDAGGVGVIANKKLKNDPRYKTSLTVDVKPDSPLKNLRAFRLVDSQTTPKIR
jgi:hypothetical protein